MNKYVLLFLIILIFITKGLYSQTANIGEKFTCFNSICLAKSTLTDVQVKLGKAKITETGDAGEYEAALYYYYPKENILIKFYSSELGGNEKELVGYTFKKNMGAKLPAGCKTVDKNIDLNVGGIYVGMKREDFMKLFSKTQQVNKNTDKFTFSHVEKLNGTDYDVTITIEGIFKNNRLDKFEIAKTITN